MEKQNRTKQKKKTLNERPSVSDVFYDTEAVSPRLPKRLGTLRTELGGRRKTRWWGGGRRKGDTQKKKGSEGGQKAAACALVHASVGGKVTGDD